MAIKKYVVVVDAISTNTGNKKADGKDEVVRILRGTTIEADDKDPKILQLLEFRSVVPESKYKAGMRVTPKIVLAAMGAPDDPIVEPDPDVIPLAAPAGTSLD